MEYAGAEEHRLLPLGARAAAYSLCQADYGRRDPPVGHQLSELGAVYRLADALLLSRRGDAPAIMGRTNRSKTPYVAVLLSTGAAFLTVVVNYYAPAKVFKFLIDSSGAIALLVYLVIAVSQLRMRKILQAQGGEIRLRMWLYPYLTWLVIAFITFVLVVMLFRPAQQLEVISTGLLALGIICTVPIMSRWKKLVLWQKLPLQNTR